jgi:hypothetical protein
MRPSWMTTSYVPPDGTRPGGLLPVDAQPAARSATTALFADLNW